MELLVTRLSSVHELKEFNGISGRFGGLSVSSFCSAATISLFVVVKTRSSNKANLTSSCDRYQRCDESFLLVATEMAS